MVRIVAIVEGDGEVKAVPVLIRRIGAEVALRARMSGPYSPTADQAALTARFDLTAARRRAPSFDKMWRAVSALLQGC